MRETGIDALHVGDIGMARAVDTEIIAAAKREDRVVVTLDADFHTLLALSAASKPSVIRIRIEGLKGAELYMATEIVASGSVVGEAGAQRPEHTRQYVRSASTARPRHRIAQ